MAFRMTKPLEVTFEGGKKHRPHCVLVKLFQKLRPPPSSRPPPAMSNSSRILLEVHRTCLHSHGKCINTVCVSIDEAASEGHWRCVSAYLRGATFSKERLGTALLNAIRSNRSNPETVIALLDAGVDPNGVYMLNNVTWTPLCLAILEHHAELVRVLLSRGASPHVSLCEKSPLQWYSEDEMTDAELKADEVFNTIRCALEAVSDRGEEDG
jgi:hypothetical protein